MQTDDDVYILSLDVQEFVPVFADRGDAEAEAVAPVDAPAVDDSEPTHAEATELPEEFTYGEPVDCGPVRFEIGDGIYVQFLDGVSYEQGVGVLVANLGDEWAEALVIGATNQGDGIWHIANGGGGFEVLS